MAILLIPMVRTAALEYVANDEGMAPANAELQRPVVLSSSYSCCHGLDYNYTNHRAEVGD